MPLSLIDRISTGKLNTVNDTQPGGVSNDGNGLAPGQLGGEVVLTAAQALKLSDTSVGTLYAGRYKYVQFYVSQTGTTNKGGPVYWQDPDNYIVTADAATSGLGFCGVALSVVTKGNYGWILVEGKVQAAALDNTTKASPAAGDIMICATIGRFDDIVDPYASELTSGKVAGQWIEAPVDGTSVRYLAYVKYACQIG